MHANIVAPTSVVCPSSIELTNEKFVLFRSNVVEVDTEHIPNRMRSNYYYFLCEKCFLFVLLLLNHPCRSIVRNHFQLIALMFSISFGQILIYCLGNALFSLHLSFRSDSTQIIVVK